MVLPSPTHPSLTALLAPPYLPGFLRLGSDPEKAFGKQGAVGGGSIRKALSYFVLFPFRSALAWRERGMCLIGLLSPSLSTKQATDRLTGPEPRVPKGAEAGACVCVQMERVRAQGGGRTRGARYVRALIVSASNRVPTPH